MNILNLFRPSPTEQAIEAELAGTTKPTRAHIQPPKRGGTSSNLPEAGADELHQLRASLQDIEARLSSVTHERDSIRAEFSQYRTASQSDQRSLEKENARLQAAFNETSQALSRSIASAGLSAPVPGISPDDPTDEAKGLQRSIAAAKAEASRTKPQPLTRPVI